MSYGYDKRPERTSVLGQILPQSRIAEPVRATERASQPITKGVLQAEGGTFSISVPEEVMLVGAATAPTTGIGIFLGRDGTDYEFRVGNPAGNYLHWNGSALTLNGVLSGATGTFSGSLSGATGTFAGSLSAATGTFAGTVSGSSFTASTAFFSGGVVVGALNGVSITANGLFPQVNFTIGSGSQALTFSFANPTVTGSKGGNAALGSLISALAGLGLVTDSTT